MKKNLANKWKRTELVIALIVLAENKHRQVLMGPKKTGVMKGYFAPVGGHIDEGETLPEACAREIFEESGLVIMSEKLNVKGVTVARLLVRIIDRRQLYVVWVIRLYRRDLSGVLKPDKREFSWLRFTDINRVSPANIAPGDDSWLYRVIDNQETVDVQFDCGADRTDLKRVVVKELYALGRI